jgi:predicted nucleotidyltransferase
LSNVRGQPSPATKESERRREIADRIVKGLSARTDLRATLLAGSVAQGTADEHSDIDLLNYYTELPDQQTFDEALREAGGERIGDLGDPRPEGFAVRYRFDGIEVQTGGQLISDLDRRIGRIEAGDVDWITAKVAMGLLEGIPLHGDELIREWQSRSRYPEALRRREVEANLGWFPIWALDQHLAARDAELFRRQMLLEGAFKVVAVLSAVNRLYFTTFQFKRAGAHIDQMKVKPDRLAERLDRVANAPPSEAADELRQLVEEAKAIARRELQDVDVDAPWQPLKNA